ncbi:MAG: hypothetical protein D3924_13075 [Candidatus Electrothrix sp. AR4]|nr:hypothetical protein [Candidatus Electrothrix sp. AR4]
MLKVRLIIMAVFVASLFCVTQAYADWGKTEIAYWGATGTVYCNNYESVSVQVGLGYLHRLDALSALEQRAVFVCSYRGGVYRFTGDTYYQWILYR